MIQKIPDEQKKAQLCHRGKIQQYPPRCIERYIWPHQPYKTEANLIIKKNRYFKTCDGKNPGYRIIELICYCFLTNLGIQFQVHKLNNLIKNVSLIQYKDIVPIYPYLISERDEIVRSCDRH